jgi:vancomycin resistance protein VanJ
LVETFLPWLGILIVILAVAAVIRRSLFAVAAVIVAAAAWALIFGAVVLPHPATGTASVTIASENIDASNDDPSRAAAALESTGADVIALQELNQASLPVVSKTLATEYPHSYVVGTVGVWSKTGLSNGLPLDLGLGWKRALSVDVQTSSGPLRLYAVHMASVRPGQYAGRNTMLAALKTTLAADTSPRVAVAGDFNSASTDREFEQLTDSFSEAPVSGLGFGFTWPSQLPVARLDHVLLRGLTTVSSSVMAGNGSDHRGVVVSVR